MSGITDYRKTFEAHPTLCNWFQFFAIETWNRIGFARTRKGLKIWETTITQNLLFQFQLVKDILGLHQASPWQMEMMEAVKEKTNGNDIELFVQTKAGLLFFAIQAKIINHNGFKQKKMVNGNYKEIEHSNSNGEQIELLCKYAKDKKGIPLYLLYNFVNQSFKKKSSCEIEFDIEQYGCSIVSANIIKSKFRPKDIWKIPTFSDLHPDIALPWFVIPCCFTGMTKKEILNLLDNNKINVGDLKLYDLDELKKDKNWKPLSVLSKSVSEERGDQLPRFGDYNPRFRFIVFATEITK